jgi:hypothetical protein
MRVTFGEFGPTHDFLTIGDAEATKFWPVYDQYTADVIKINDKKFSLIQGKMTNEQSLSFVRPVSVMLLTAGRLITL